MNYNHGNLAECLLSISIGMLVVLVRINEKTYRLPSLLVLDCQSIFYYSFSFRIYILELQ